MLAPMSWIKRFTDIDVDAKTFNDSMIMTGSEVEGYEIQGENINKVVVAKIEKITPHEDADKLCVCYLNIGEDELLQVVTGADNVFEGAYVPVALVGAQLPNGLKIKKGKLRGVVSNGMLCSGGELLINDGVVEGAEYDGILILKGEPEVGTPIQEAIDYNDIIIDFKTYANRPDTLSIIGLSREVSATFGTPFNEPDYYFGEDEKKSEDFVSVEIQDADLCPRYIGKIVYDIKIEPSPHWMQRLLTAAGVRPINNIVDITNFVMLEIGQPMHAFDFKYVKDGSIIVRRANEGEEITTLDGKQYTLTCDNLCICDSEKPIALAGVMGGENSMVYPDTNIILFESANFNPYNVRKTSRSLGIRTESSSRYEKGIDPAACERGLNRAMHLLEVLGAGKIAEGMVDACYADLNKREIEVDSVKINRLLDQNIAPSEMAKILEKLFVKTKVNGDKLVCAIPTYRSDLENDADIAEEIMRIYGYDKIPSTLPRNMTEAGGRSAKQKKYKLIRDTMVSMGLFQALSYSFMSPSDFSKLGFDEKESCANAVKISNPMGEDYSIMRKTLIPSLLTSVSNNKNHNIPNVKLFEMDRTFMPQEDENELPLEMNILGAAINAKDEDFYTLKGRLEELFLKFNVKDVQYATGTLPYLHPGRSAFISAGENHLGYIGEIHPDAAEKYDISGKTIVCEVDIDALIESGSDEMVVKDIPKYPAVQRDLAVVISASQQAGPLIGDIRKIGGKLLENCEIFDIYQSEQIGKDKKSVAFSLSFRAEDRTLVDDEVNKIFDKIVSGLGEKYKAEIRS